MYCIRFEISKVVKKQNYASIGLNLIFNHAAFIFFHIDFEILGVSSIGRDLVGIWLLLGSRSDLDGFSFLLVLDWDQVAFSILLHISKINKILYLIIQNFPILSFLGKAGDLGFQIGDLLQPLGNHFFLKLLPSAILLDLKLATSSLCGDFKERSTDSLLHYT